MFYNVDGILLPDFCQNTRWKGPKMKREFPTRLSPAKSSSFSLVKLLEDYGYRGSRHFDAHAYRGQDYQGVKDFARGCMRTYLILKEKTNQWNTDSEIQKLVKEINANDGSTNVYFGAYSREKAEALKAKKYAREILGKRGLAYERLDQLTVDLLLGVR
jgi:xylose isomerase